MLEFSENKPIYRQIADYAFNCIIGEMWLPGAQIPSVRDLSAALGVNSRTVMKAFDYLLEIGVIELRRGMGFFLRPEARDKVLAVGREDFFKTTLPAFIDEMKRLDIKFEQLIEIIKKN